MSDTPDFRTLAESLIETCADLQRQVLLKHTTAIIEELHAQITKRNADLAAANAENAVLRDAIKDALPWMIKLGDYIGNGTQADPMGRCNAILKMRIAVEKRDD